MTTKTLKNISDTIISAAQNVFARYGFKKSTMEDIAAAAHKAKSSLYYYFKNKEDILKEIIEKEYTLFIKEIKNAIGNEITPQKKFRAFLITRNEIIDKFLNFNEVLRDEYFEQYGFVQKFRKQYYDEELKIIYDILEEGVKKKIFFIDDLELTSFVIVTALKGFEYPWFVENHESKNEENIDKLLDVFFNGITRK